MLRPIPLFPPPQLKRHPLSVETLPLWPQHHWQYASSGKSCIYHILKSYGIRGKVALPSYACASLLVPLRELGLTPVYFDLDERDLNPSIASLEDVLSRDPAIQAVLLTSLYGNPAALNEAENLCAEKGVLLVDDAAQCFGATLDGRPLGTFGGAGFFSFSPGKPTAAHMGGFFWSKGALLSEISRTKHPLIHRLRWFFFKVQRLEYDSWQWGELLWKFSRKIYDRLESKMSLWNDDIEDFEIEILGGVLDALQEGRYAFRMDALRKIAEKSRAWTGVRLIQALRGDAHTHKWVMVFEDKGMAAKFKQSLLARHIAFLGGYSPLAPGCEVADSLVGRIVELPLLEDEGDMDALISFVDHNLGGHR